MNKKLGNKLLPLVHRLQSIHANIQEERNYLRTTRYICSVNNLTKIETDLNNVIIEIAKLPYNKEL